MRKSILVIAMCLVFSITSLAADINRYYYIYLDDDVSEANYPLFEGYYKPYETDKFIVYTDDDYESSPAILNQIQQIITSVTPLFEAMESRLGNVSDVNNDGKVAIVFHDLPSNINGLFHTAHLITGVGYNGTDILEINDKYIEGGWSNDYAVSLIIHEGQHMIYQNNRNADFKIINEGLSVFVQDYYVPGSVDDHLDQHFAYMDNGRRVDYHNYYNNLVLFNYLYDEFGGWNTIVSIADSNLLGLYSIMNTIGYNLTSEADTKEFFTDYMHWMLTWERLYNEAQRPAPITGTSETGIDVERLEYVVRWIQPGKSLLDLTLDSGNSKIEYVVEEIEIDENQVKPVNMKSIRSYNLPAGTHTIQLSDKNNILAMTPIFYDDSAPTTWAYSYAVSDQNLSPQANDDTYEINEKETLIATTVLSNDSDEEDDVLTTAELLSSVINGTLIFNSDGSFTYIPNEGFIGNDGFTYSITDSDGATATATVTISVLDVPNTLPVVTLNGSASINLKVGDTYVEEGATAKDAEDGSLNVLISSGEVDTTSPAALEIIYTATDTEGGKGSAKRTVNISEKDVLDEAPQIIMGEASIELQFGQAFIDDVSVTDQEDDLLGSTIEVEVDGLVDPYTAGIYELLYTATDSAGNKVSARRTVTVHENNVPLVSLSGSDITIDFGKAFDYPTATAVDVEDGDLSVVRSGEANNKDAGTYVIDYTATDSAGASDTKSITITVLPEPEVEKIIVVVEDPEEIIVDDVLGDPLAIPEPIPTPEPTTSNVVRSGGGGGGGSSVASVVTVAQKNTPIIVGNQASIEVEPEKGTNVVTIDTSQLVGVKALQIVSERAKMVIPMAAIKAFDSIKLEVSAEVELTSEEKAVVGNGTVYAFNMVGISEDGSETEVTKFSEPIEITVPYKLIEGENPALITVFYLTEQKVLENVKGTYVDGQVTFKTNHFSQYVVKENSVIFSDTSDMKIRTLAAKGIINGKGDGIFDPEGSLTRAELATLLVRALDLELTTETTEFNDVSPTDWYYAYIMTAKASGIVEGVGEGNYKPLAQVKTQDAIIMISRIMERYFESENKSANLEFFDTAAYAKPYVTHLVQLGFVEEDFEGGELDIKREAMVELVYAMYFYQ